jgi:hypothetical protein
MTIKVTSIIGKLYHDHVVAHVGLVVSGLHELVVVREAHVVVLQPLEAMHHVGATCVHSGDVALASHVAVDVLFLILFQKLSQVGLVLVQRSGFLFTNPT